MSEAVPTAPNFEQLKTIEGLTPAVIGRVLLSHAANQIGENPNIQLLIEAANSAFIDAFGLEQSKEQITDFEQLFIKSNGEVDEGKYDIFLGVTGNLIANGVLNGDIVRFPDIEGERIYQMHATIAEENEGEGAPFQAEFHDVTKIIRELEFDETTEVATRHGLEATVEDLMNGNNPYGLIFIDLGEFKSINDNFGHLTGDSALRKVGEILKAAVRVNRGDSVVFRYGGDEFVIALNDCTEEGLQVVMQRIREKISEVNSFQQEEEKALDIELPRLKITAGSVHSSELQEGENPIDIADKRMYEQKTLERYEILKEQAGSLFTNSKTLVLIEKAIDQIDSSFRLNTSERINLLTSACFLLIREFQRDKSINPLEDAMQLSKLAEIAKRVGYDYDFLQKFDKAQIGEESNRERVIVEFLQTITNVVMQNS